MSEILNEFLNGNKTRCLQERMGLGGNGGREELARENLELKASDRKLPLKERLPIRCGGEKSCCSTISGVT